MNPVTICVESAATSKFGAYMATATKATVKYLDTYTTPYASCADYIVIILFNRYIKRCQMKGIFFVIFD
jgi:hypothetical protein